MRGLEGTNGKCRALQHSRKNWKRDSRTCSAFSRSLAPARISRRTTGNSQNETCKRCLASNGRLAMKLFRQTSKKPPKRRKQVFDSFVAHGEVLRSLI